MLDVRPGVSTLAEAALSTAFARAAIDLDGSPIAYGSAWRRAGLAEATECADGLGALAAEHAWSDTGVVEP